MNADFTHPPTTPPRANIPKLNWAKCFREIRPDTDHAKRKHRCRSFLGLILIQRRRNVGRAKVIADKQQLRVQNLGQGV